MANKSICSPKNPRLQLNVVILQSHKDYLDSLGVNISEYIRQLLDAQMNTHEGKIKANEREISKKQLEINFLKADNERLKAESEKKELTDEQRAKVINTQVEEIFNIFKEYNQLSKIRPYIKVRAEGINNKLNGNKPVTAEELEKCVIKLILERGEKIND